MSRDRELIMEIEVAGRTFSNQKEKLLVTTLKAKPIVHFRRHAKWGDYMNGTIDGTTAASKDDLLYGFDWLGDEYYDFGKTNTLADREGRYNYLFNNVASSISDPDTNSTSKVQKLMYDRSYTSVETLTTAKRNLKNVYKQGAKITTVHGKEYLPSWMALKYDREVKICLGLRNENTSTDPQFGDNDDIIHLMPETGYEDSFEISPTEIKKSDFSTGSVEITLKCVRPIDKNISVIAYHTDNSTTKEEDGSININTNGIKVGELRMMKNDENFILDITIVKVKQRTRHFRSAFGAFSSQGEVEKILQRGLGQGMIRCLFSSDTIDKDDSGGSLKMSTDTSFGGVDNYNNYINNQYLYKKYVAKIATDNATNATNITPVSFANFESNTAGVKTLFETKRQLLLFMHDYTHSTGLSRVNGAADSLDVPQSNIEGKWASIFKTADKQTLVHETAHTLGLPHTFNLETIKATKISYFPMVSGRMVRTIVDLFLSGKQGVCFHKRHLNARHLFVRGSTENIMDYSQKFQWDESKVTHLRRANPTGLPNRANCVARPYIYRAQTNGDFYEMGSPIANPKQRISFWKWQWQFLQADDEVIIREVVQRIKSLKPAPITPLKFKPTVTEPIGL